MIILGRQKLVFLILVSVAFMAACGPNRRIMDSAKPTPAPPAANATPMSELERDLQTMRTADFNFVHVFRRNDGAELDAEDKKFMNANMPAEINRRVISDRGRALITGSNFRFPAENFKNLTERFSFEDFSRSESKIKGANSNSAK